jgi:Domain of unknown function (DUF4157)
MQVHDFEVSPSRAVRAAAPSTRANTHATPVQAIVDLQRLAGNQSVSSLLEEEGPSRVREVVGSGGGSPLDAGTRSFMEERLGQDFSDVRVHTGAQADGSARSINAQAYTAGTDVVFRSGVYAPETDSGRAVLAHELTHVVQQRAGPVAGTPTPGGIRLSDPSDAFEQAAERSAATVMSGGVPDLGTSSAGSGSVQRQTGDEEEEIQPLVAQRVDAEEEEELET